MRLTGLDRRRMREAPAAGSRCTVPACVYALASDMSAMRMFESSQTAPGAEGATQSQRNSTVTVAVTVAVAMAVAVTIAVSVAVTVAMAISSLVLSRRTAVRMVVMLRRHGGDGERVGDWVEWRLRLARRSIRSICVSVCHAECLRPQC